MALVGPVVWNHPEDVILADPISFVVLLGIRLRRRLGLILGLRCIGASGIGDCCATAAHAMKPKR